MVKLDMALVVLVALLAIGAELWHGRRCRTAAAMVFARPRRGLAVVAVAAAVRVTGVTVTAASLVLLWHSSIVTRNSTGAVASTGEMDRMIVIMDASNSMNLQDAGPDGSETRASRARTLIHQLINRAGRMPRVTLVTFGESALPVVHDSRDWDVLSNVLLRQYYSTSFKSEKTDIDHAVTKSLRMARDWVKKSTVVVLVTDGEGDTAYDEFEVPPSVRQFIVVGVGSPEGRPIGRNPPQVSRQDAENLQRIARLVGGEYFDGTRELLPEEYIDRALPPPPPAVPPETHREFALVLFAVGVAVLALLPLALSTVEKRLLRP
jgi:hypothetical protein